MSREKSTCAMSAGVYKRSTGSNETVSKRSLVSGCLRSVGARVSVSQRSTSASIGELSSLVSDIRLAILFRSLEEIDIS